ncbi:MAG: hypothetical protein V4691_05645 [Pseudomonadota bacterium]
MAARFFYIIVLGFSVWLGATSHVSFAQSAQSKSQKDIWNPEQLLKHIEKQHPASYFMLATKLFERGEKEEAVFWFYVGQIRFRSYLGENPQLKESGDPALFGSLMATVGPPINEYAFGDIPALMKTIDRALEWDAAHDDAFSKKGKIRDEMRQGLVDMKKQVLEQQDDIRATRKKNGLENRK